MKNGSHNAAAERRQWPRLHFDIGLRATLREQGKRVAVHGRGNDLSRGGVSAFLPVELVVGQQIELDLALPYSSHPLKLRAVVRNRRSFTYGLEFRQLSAFQRATIERTCAALALVE